MEVCEYRSSLELALFFMDRRFPKLQLRLKWIPRRAVSMWCGLVRQLASPCAKAMRSLQVKSIMEAGFVPGDDANNLFLHGERILVGVLSKNCATTIACTCKPIVKIVHLSWNLVAGSWLIHACTSQLVDESFHGGNDTHDDPLTYTSVDCPFHDDSHNLLKKIHNYYTMVPTISASAWLYDDKNNKKIIHGCWDGKELLRVDKTSFYCLLLLLLHQSTRRQTDRRDWDRAGRAGLETNDDYKKTSY